MKLVLGLTLKLNRGDFKVEFYSMGDTVLSLGGIYPGPRLSLRVPVRMSSSHILKYIRRKRPALRNKSHDSQRFSAFNIPTKIRYRNGVAYCNVHTDHRAGMIVFVFAVL
jgi:hypothetical protein